VTAVLGGHARAKAVGALPFEDAGLKGSFHDKLSSGSVTSRALNGVRQKGRVFY
jgi:hypothetical protein